MYGITKYLESKFSDRKNKIQVLFVIYKLQNNESKELVESIIQTLDSNIYIVDLLVLCKSEFDLNVNTSINYMYESESLLWYSQSKNGLNFSLNLDVEYDVIISFFSLVASSCIANLDTNANKIAFIDNEFDIAHNGYTTDYFKEIYNKLDNIICIKESIGKSILEYIGDEFDSKIYVEPIYDNEEVLINKQQEIYTNKYNNNAIEEISCIVSNNDVFTIVSVGRLNVDKGFDKLIKVHKRLLDTDIKNKVIVIGEGFDRKAIEDCIKINNVEDTFILEGYKDNPYKYIYNADLFVLASNNEGLPLVIMESMILEKAIVGTNVNGTKELLKDGYGMLVEDSEEGIYKGIKEMILNEKLRCSYINKLRNSIDKFKFDSKLIAPRIEHLLESNISNNSNDKKNILMVLQIMAGGGCEKAFLNTLDIIDYDKYNVDVIVLIKHMGDMYTYNSNVNVRYIYEDLADFYNNYNSDLKFDLDKIYDLEIAYSDIVSVEFIINSGNENTNKIAWIHGDIRFFEVSRTKEHISNLYQKIDKIVCVSNDSKNILIDYLGSSIEDKVEVIYNPMPINSIKSLAINNNEIFSCICIGRLSYEKGMDRLIKVHKRLIDAGIKNELKIIGDGCQKEILEKLIKELGVKETCKLVGHLENPYNFIKNSDLVISPSREEGFGIVMAEAMVLEKPIVATATNGAIDVLEYKYGLITLNTEDDLYIGMKNMIQDYQFREFYINNLKRNNKFKFDKKYVIPQIEQGMNIKEGKIKLLVVTLGFWGGGGEVALINTLNNLNYEKYEVDLLVLVESNIMLEKIDKSKVNILPHPYKTEIEANEDLSKETPTFKLDNIYDVEVAYLGRQSIEFIVKNSKSNSKKIAWIHGDIKFTIGDKDINYIKELFNNMNEVICVSKGTVNQLIEYIGEHKNYELKTIYPPIDIDYITKKSYI